MSVMSCPAVNPELIHDLSNVSIAGFVVTDLILYLDTHPYDREALNYFNYYNRMYRKMSEDFAEKHFPLTISDTEACNKEWKWGLAPLPWERM